MSNVSGSRVEPRLTSARQEPSEWYYDVGGKPQGPFTVSHIQGLLGQKIINGSTLIWREDFGQEWQRFDQTRLWPQPAAHRAVPPPVNRGISEHLTADKSPPSIEGVDQKWQKTFDEVAKEESGWSIVNKSGTKRTASERMQSSWKIFSFWGFIFGPFYYMYLKMWRKAVLLFALAPCAWLLDDGLHATRFASLLLPTVCATMAKRDYYKFRMKGETVWPIFRFSKNIYTDLAIVAGIIVAGLGLDFFFTQ